jgi:hypothetical protein
MTVVQAFGYRSTIRPASGGDGPFWVHTEDPAAEPTTNNVTLGITTIPLAFAQVTADIGALLSGKVFDSATIMVQAHTTA